MKNKATKILSMFLAMVMLVSGLEFTVFASNVTSIDSAESSASIEPIQELTNIEKEIVSERTAYSKVYLLEDGSYCNIETAVPIHEKNHNDEWVEIESSAFSENIETVDDARTMIQTVSAEQIENASNSATNRSLTNSEETYPLTIRAIENVTMGDSINMGAWGAIVAKPTSFYNYLDHNKVILKAFVSADCVCNAGHKSSNVSVFEKTAEWDENTDFEGYYFDEVEPLIYSNTVNADGTYSWDITNIYTQWDKGVLANNGFVLGTTSVSCNIVLSSICILVIYKDIDETDTESTYHTIDMNRAGTVFVNDLTSTVKVQQDIITIPRSVLPISLKRIYNLSEVYKDTNLTGFRWNYESSIEFKDGLLLWKTFDGTVKRFVQSNPTVENGDYTKWDEVNNGLSTSASTAILWVKTTELSKSNYDYSNFYIIANELRYSFNSSGKLILIESVEDDELYVGVNYNGNIMTGVYYTSGDVTTSVQIMSLGNNKTRIHLATTNAASDATTYQIIVNIQDTYNSSNGTTTNRVTYNDGHFVEYVFNYKHELKRITDENGSTVDFAYTESSTDGSRLLEYEKTPIDGVNEYIQIIDSDTYRRYYWSSLYDEMELIQYNKDFRVISHLNYNGKYTFVSYDENGTVTSYVVNSENGIEKLSCGDFESRPNRVWGEPDSPPSNYVSYNDIPSIQESAPFSTGNTCAKFHMGNKQTTYINQPISSLSLEKTYVFGAWVYVDDALATGDINVEVTSSVNNESFMVHFDPTAIGCWQYALTACKFTDVSDVMFNINLVNQKGTIYVDNATLYEATAASVDVLDSISVSPFEIQNNADGSISKEIITDGVMSLAKSYTYENQKISSVTDLNGVTTYFGYDADTGTLNKLGTLEDAAGNIINPTEMICTISGLPTYIEQNVKNISTDANIQMLLQYSYDVDERITSISNNGVIYHFEYIGDKLDKVSKNNETMVNYDYTNEQVGQITYNNGLVINYSYNNGKISTINLSKSGTPYKNYTYAYKNTGELDSVVENVSNIKIAYLDNGFEIYSLAHSESLPVYRLIESTDGNIAETYYPDVYTNESIESASKNSVTKVTGNNTKHIDTFTGETIISSEQLLTKIYNWASEDQYDETIYELNRESVTDYFGRISETTTLVNRNSDESSLKLTEKYTYKDMSPTTTSTLVSSHTSKIDLVDSNNSPTNIVNTKQYFEYDHRGNIVFVYEINNNVKMPVCYYQYDEANQLVGEYDVANGLSVTYTYDRAGNITNKIYHDANSVIVNNDSVEDFGTVLETISYSYDTISRDLLTNYNGTQITYDDFGNPLVYSGKRYTQFADGASSDSDYYEENFISGTCEWTGKYLTAFETETNRYTYDYNEDGYRVKKSCFEKYNGTFRLTSEVTYIWISDKLSGFISNQYTYDNNGVASSSVSQSDILYDENGEAIGFMFADAAEWFFAKDINGSVVGLVTSGGTHLASISYDAWGMPQVCFNVDTDTSGGRWQYVILDAIFSYNPIGYKGYLFDFETGLYFSKDKIYSPAWSRYINHVDYENQLSPNFNVTSSNMYAFCKNNPIANFDPYSYIANIKTSKIINTDVASGLDVEMNEAFLSRVFCSVFANYLVKRFGSWEYNSGSTVYGMDASFMAISLFAHNIAKYKYLALNAVNTSWGEGWAMQTSLQNSVKLYKNDANKSNYEMIWNAADLIMQYT